MRDKIGKIDLAIVLGSGLSELLAEHSVFERIPYAELALPVARLAGHAGEALWGNWHGKRVLAFAGRVHAYQGFTATEITRAVTLARDRGAKTLLLTNAAGAINPELNAGDLMLISDHINLTGMNPLIGTALEDPFVNMTGAYSSRLRKLARQIDPSAREGVYAGLMGPTYETPAEAHYLRTIGADAVGMSTVLETIAARAAGIEVFGVSLITNSVAAPDTSHAEVTEIAKRAASRLAKLLDGLVQSTE
ncbi:MAG TPA: purine-nucleoside phosphorylase [Candidatus Rubrimentiphilum sp.]|nr:purine-nucleoside phosphorylase [Candidatus Rubrimentiphilum sp.]